MTCPALGHTLLCLGTWTPEGGGGRHDWAVCSGPLCACHAGLGGHEGGRTRRGKDCVWGPYDEPDSRTGVFLPLAEHAASPPGKLPNLSAPHALTCEGSRSRLRPLRRGGWREKGLRGHKSLRVTRHSPPFLLTAASWCSRRSCCPSPCPCGLTFGKEVMHPSPASVV